MHLLGNNRSALSSVNKAMEEEEKQTPGTGEEKKKRRKWNSNYISCICRWDFEKKKTGEGETENNSLPSITTNEAAAKKKKKKGHHNSKADAFLLTTSSLNKYPAAAITIIATTRQLIDLQGESSIAKLVHMHAHIEKKKTIK